MTYLLQPRYTENKLVGNSIQKARGGPLGGYFFLPLNLNRPSERIDAYEDGVLIPKSHFVEPIRIKGRSETDMPDVFENGMLTFVSNKARQVIEDLDPGSSVFTELEFVATKKILHPPYFYWHVDPFRQTFDFVASNCDQAITVSVIARDFDDPGVAIQGERPHLGQDVKIVRASLGCGSGGGSARWRVINNTEDYPRFWRESNVIRDGFLYTGLRPHIFMSDHAFDVLDKALPGQLLPERVAVSSK
jgi:hypothetical protein